MFTYGAGYLDVDAALGNTDLATGLALSPTAVLNANGSVTIDEHDSRLEFRWQQRGLGSHFGGLGQFGGLGL